MSVLASVNSPPFPVGSRWPLDGTSVAATIRDTGRPARLDAACGVPIFVDGGIWGGIGTSPEDDRPLPPDTTERLAAVHRARRRRHLECRDTRPPGHARRPPDIVAPRRDVGGRGGTGRRAVRGGRGGGDAGPRGAGDGRLPLRGRRGDGRGRVPQRAALPRGQPLGARRAERGSAGLRHRTAGPDRRLLRPVGPAGGGRAGLRARIDRRRADHGGRPDLGRRLRGHAGHGSTAGRDRGPLARLHRPGRHRHRERRVPPAASPAGRGTGGASACRHPRRRGRRPRRRLHGGRQGGGADPRRGGGHGRAVRVGPRRRSWSPRTETPASRSAAAGRWTDRV